MQASPSPARCRRYRSSRFSSSSIARVVLLVGTHLLVTVTVADHDNDGVDASPNRAWPTCVAVHRPNARKLIIEHCAHPDFTADLRAYLEDMKQQDNYIPHNAERAAQ